VVKKAEVLTLFEYNYWANRLILRAADGLSPEQFTAPVRLSFGSLRGTLVHTFATEQIWRKRCQEGVSLLALPSEVNFPNLAALRQAWEQEENAMRAYLASLLDDDFQRPVRYTNTRGVPYETVLWQILAHVVNHGTQFRSEAGVALTEFGLSPGDVDFIFFIRQGGIISVA
jgi:uncharacterized damage-inducible protein DinB